VSIRSRFGALAFARATRSIAVSIGFAIDGKATTEKSRAHVEPGSKVVALSADTITFQEG